MSLTYCLAQLLRMQKLPDLYVGPQTNTRSFVILPYISTQTLRLL